MHTETTLRDLEIAITRYGKLLRRFASQVCPHYETEETPKEYQARARRASKKAAQQQQASGSALSVAGPVPAAKPKKAFNLNRIKLHSLGDYPWAIRFFGTNENYSTLRVSNSLHTS